MGMRGGGKMWWMYIRWMNMKTVSTFPGPSGGGGDSVTLSQICLYTGRNNFYR